MSSNKLKNALQLANLSFKQTTLTQLKRFQTPPTSGFPIINMSFKGDPHAGVFSLRRVHQYIAYNYQKYLLYLCKVSQMLKTNQPLPPPDGIQNNLNKYIIKTLTEQKVLITMKKYRPIHTKYIECHKIYGVLLHRQLNLQTSYYKVDSKRPGTVKYISKKSMSTGQANNWFKNLEQYEKQNLQQLYCQTMQQYIRGYYFTRTLCKLTTNLVLEVQHKDGKSQLIGDSGPTQHYLQLQELENSFTRDKIFITDADFALGGNVFTQ